MVINPIDNVEVREDGHKYARRNIAAGENVIKYGMPIGHATVDIAVGEHVHVHNLATNLGEVVEYRYEPGEKKVKGEGQGQGEKVKGEGEHWSGDSDSAARWGHRALPMFAGYRRRDGRVGIRNDIWIVPLVGCVNSLCERLAKSCDGIALTHPYGCSQLGADHELTANTLAALCMNPNAGGVLVVALGCENNTLESFRERLRVAEEVGRQQAYDSKGEVARQQAYDSKGEVARQQAYDSKVNVRFLRAQDPGDEFERGLELIEELKAARPTERVEVPVSELVVGLKCGGSDGFSGLTANPLVGRFSDWLIERGGSTVLTEVPEMFGAETLLMNRCRTRAVFDDLVKMINGFKSYYAEHHQPCYENPSPGNKAGGISTLEDKSLGCVQKGGSAPVEAVLGCGERVAAHGLSLMNGPGNDLVASTLLAAAGCHLILFTTGRGTPFGTVVPTLKIASNDELAAKKPNWIDWNAMSNGDVDEFAAKILKVASGERARNEIIDARQIALFKNGVTL